MSCSTVKSKVEVSHNLVAFSEYMNFTNKITYLFTMFDKANDVSFREAANVATDDATLPQKNFKNYGVAENGNKTGQ